jgi:PAS domain S-box-containing protein
VAEEQVVPVISLADVLFDVAGVGRCLVAPDGTVLRTNAEWLRSTRYSAEQVIGADIIELFPEARHLALATHARARAGHDVAVPLQLQHVLGQETWWEGRICPVPMDGGVGVLITARDITKQVLAEEALRESEHRYSVIYQGRRASEERYRSLYDHMSEGLAYCRMLYDGDRPLDFVYLDVNPAFEVLTGLKAVVGKKVSEVIPGILDSDSCLIETYGRVARLGTSERFEIYVECLSAWFDVSVYCPALGHFVATFHIITERKRAEERLRASEERLRLAQEVARVGTFEWNIQTGVNTWTTELEALYGLPRDGFAKTRAAWEDLVHPDDRAEAVRRVEEAFQTGARTEAEWRVVWPDGSVHWLAARWQLFKDGSGKPLRMTGMNIDITERKRAEELRASEAALREADRQKNQFLAMLSHELRNPLASIRNAAFILEHADATREQAIRARGVIGRQAEHLARLVDDLLDMSRIERGRIELRRSRVDLREVLCRSVDDFGSLMEGRGVALRTNLPDIQVWADADATRVTQVVGNLLHNAAKFTPRGGEVALSLHLAGGEAVISVRDTGAGIGPALLPRVFEQFVQGDRAAEGMSGGLGLGLALVKNLTELHGGTVRAESAGRGKGAEFVVRLPRLVEPAELR